jgi:hypothetical protein
MVPEQFANKRLKVTRIGKLIQFFNVLVLMTQASEGECKEELLQN